MSFSISGMSSGPASSMLLFLLCWITATGAQQHSSELPSPGAVPRHQQQHHQQVPPGGAGGAPPPGGDCQPEAMARCTDPLKVVTGNKDLGFATSIDELQKMCP